MRNGSGAYKLATCAGVYVLDRWLSRRQYRARRIGFSAAFAGVCLALLGGMMFRLKSEPQVNSIAGVLLYRNGYRGAVAASETVNNAAVTAPSAYSRPADGNLGIYYSDHSAWRWPALYAYSLLSNACGPLLWQVKNIRMGMALPEGLAILGLFSYLVACWRRTDRILRLFTIQAVAWLLLVGFINDNIGTAMRLRAPAVMLLMVCGAVVHYRGREPAANRKSDGSRTAAAERGQRRIDGGRHDTAGENGQPRGKHAASPLAAVDGIR